MRRFGQVLCICMLGILAFAGTTLVVAASTQFDRRETVCVYGVLVGSREWPDSTSRFIYELRILLYRDQQADSTWRWPDHFVCTRR